MKMYAISLQICFIGFLDLKNIGIDIKIMVIGALRAILWAKTCFVAAILNFLILGRNRWSDVVVPAIFEISISKTPLGQSFMLLSGSAQRKQKLLHIRPTICAWADIQASIVFHADLLYNWRLVSETSQRVLKPIKSLFD